MHQQAISPAPVTESFLDRVRKKLFYWLRITHQPVIRVYNGYGNTHELVLFGHALSVSPLPRKKYTGNIWTNTFALLRLFMVRPAAFVAVSVNFNGKWYEQTTEKDGFFRFEWEPDVMPGPGWHEVEVHLGGLNSLTAVTGMGHIYIPHTLQYAVISDIDDTFLISHSSNLRKRLYVLLTKHAYSRKPFEGVVKHYQALALVGTTVTEPNPFFYVSSSEWNLYNFITDFVRKNDLPQGIFLLSQMKSLSEAWKTGQNKHATKFMRISRILEAFPTHRFILLGDDSQQDPLIYASVVDHFRDQIKAVYLRNVFDKNEFVVNEAIARIRASGVPCCHFVHSHDAIIHSAGIGLI